MDKMEKKDYQKWSKFRSVNKNQITKQEFKLICELHSKYKNHKYFEPCSCSPKKINLWIKQINEIYDESN